jgi:hypothetical protein
VAAEITNGPIAPPTMLSGGSAPPLESRPQAQPMLLRHFD